MGAVINEQNCRAKNNNNSATSSNPHYYVTKQRKQLALAKRYSRQGGLLGFMQPDVS